MSKIKMVLKKHFIQDYYPVSIFCGKREVKVLKCKKTPLCVSSSIRVTLSHVNARCFSGPFTRVTFLVGSPLLHVNRA